MKKVLFVITLGLAVVATGCKSKKAVYANDNEVEITVPCAEYQSDAKALRATASAKSPDMNNAKQKAYDAARQELGTQISALIKRVADSYSSSYDTDQAADFRARFMNMSRTVVQQVLQGSHSICDKTTKIANKDGSQMFRHYTAMEVTQSELVQELSNKVSNEDKLRTDFEYEKFKQIFDEEMANFGK